MKKAEFECMFDRIVSNPLIELGFERSGKSLYTLKSDYSVALIRLGGRMSRPSSISHILCFRYSFLPNLNEKMNTGFEKNIFSYPIKIKPSRVKGLFGVKIKYKPSNLKFDYEVFDFDSRSENALNIYLAKILEAVKLLLDWASNTTPSSLAKDIHKRGESAWIEKLWLEALNSHTTRYPYKNP